ncbi:sugar ABC transporter substrate-binding protein [Desulfitobacterium metallireducens]|uniref:Sugar ABC transporter substrate-binding protein n=1 Tax=Desulfitobacterium metallireducens DSM 15288 TaxID=871968 RepID=W0EGC0_9FIRM|nr:substrate-binding domain-containing protein [Desulfitobacterium metallireducens]AHF08229.1 sugar ABC transporter substrate-binding protein [Desulfitobacterium metallireducens DSM 15288]
MKRILLIIFPLCLSLTITGCSLQDLLGKKQKSQSTSQSQQKMVMAVALNEQDPNKALIQRGIEDMAQKENIEVKVISSSKSQSSQGQSSGGSSNQDAASQLKGAKVLIYQGGNPELLQSIQEEKIPVVALNELPAGVKPAGIILPDPQKAGELMAEPVLTKATEGQVVVLQGDPSDSTSQEIVAVIKQSLSKNPKLTVHVIASPAGSEAVARQGLLDLLQKNPDKVPAVIAQTEKLAAQAAEVLKSQQLEKKVLLVGGQANQQSLQRMAGGTQVADVDTSPYIQGVNAFQWAQRIVNKETLDISESVTGEQGEVPAKVVPVKSVTSENLAVVQKSYAKAVETAAQTSSQNQQKQGSTSSSGSQDKKDSGSQASSQGQKGSSGQGQNQSGGTGTGGNIPQGATKVTEKVQTTITREYLDDQGKVLGTEKSSSEQNRTVPPQMIQQETQQKSQQDQGKQEQQGQQSKDSSKDKKS